MEKKPQNISYSYGPKCASQVACCVCVIKSQILLFNVSQIIQSKTKQLTFHHLLSETHNHSPCSR